jgi:hypothetical protein
MSNSPNPWDNTELLNDAFNDGMMSLGELVYFFQQLEDGIRRIVAFLVNHDDRAIGLTVACELSFKQLLHMASCLPANYYVRDRASFDKVWQALLTKAAKAEELRNTILHSTFGVSWSEEAVFVRNKLSAKMGKGLRDAGEALAPETMNAYRQQISGTYLEIEDFFSKEFPGWRTKEWLPNWDK